MNNKIVKFYPIFLVIAIILMGIGYASVNNIVLYIGGKADALIQDGIYITEVKYLESNNADLEQSKINTAYQTMMNSTIVLSPDDGDSYISYTITMYNNYNMSFSYLHTIFDKAFYDNENIIFEISDIKTDDKIMSKGYLSFVITFKYKDGVIPSSDINVLNSYLNFVFIHPVEYIESDGKQFVDTGIKPNQNITLDMEFSLNNLSEAQAIYGTRISMNGGVYHNLFLYWDSDNKIQLRWDGNNHQTYSENIYYDEGKKIRFIKNKDEILFITNGITSRISDPSIEWSLDSTAYIFSQNQTDSIETRNAYMKFYNMKMYDNGVLIRDFVPVLDKNMVACLYDKVNNQYYYNSGSGIFAYKEKFEVLDYLESSGTQYIELNVKPNSFTTAELVMSFNEVFPDTQSIFGSRTNQVDRTFNMFWYQGYLRWDFDAEIVKPPNNAQVTSPTFIKVGTTTAIINNSITNYNYTGSFNGNYNIYLYAVNNAGNAIFPNKGMKLYYFKLYQQDTVIVNLIPVKDENGVACFYDTISDTYYYNKGTGEFLFG